MQVDEVILAGDPEDGGYKFVFKRYRPNIVASSPLPRPSRSSGIALILLHAVANHKETWEPMLEHIFALQKNIGNDKTVVEAWCTECPNHGLSATTNEVVILNRPQGISAHGWAHGIQRLISSGLVSGDKIVGMGHSAAAASLTLATIGYPDHAQPFTSLILLEPALMTREANEVLMTKMDSGYSVYEQLVISAKKRRDIWPSREVAYDWFANRWPWKFWDKRELNLYVKYGLHDLPTRTYPDRTDGVTLACTRIQEASGYIYYQDGIDSLDRLSELCSIIPVHCILGDRVEVVSDDIREATVDPAQGRKMASIITIDDSGHAAVQEHPEVVGDAVWKILISITSTNRASRL